MASARDVSIAVIGPGAIGTTIAAALHEIGSTPLLAGRTPAAALHLVTDDGAVSVPGPVLAARPPRQQPVDVAFLAVKTTQTEATAPWLAALCDSRTVVCVLQNGIEQVDTIGPLVPASTVVPAVVWFPAERSTDGTVRLRGAPRISVPEGPGASVVLETLAGSRCRVDIAEDFRAEAWRKLMQNAVAGLMVLTQRRSGMFRRDDIGTLALDYLREVHAVATADGALLGDDEPERTLDRFRSGPRDVGTSILADRLADRPLEWDSRNGVVQRRGRSLGVPTPISDVVVPLLAAASEDEQAPRSASRIRTRT